MEDEILEFIHRRFKKDSDWHNGNCYFFALILNDVFEGQIVYDQIDGHFLFENRHGALYDWFGIREYDDKRKKAITPLNTIKETDKPFYDRIVRDCMS